MVARSSPSWAGVSRINRSSCNASPEGLERISRRRFVAYEPNFHNMLVLAQGVEP